ncbi:hypothetical protein PH505_ar00370 [Pseudoalteromonas distincta]|nr:hypothetical protein PH505_ar00370 [Pseudoalteromonas distincta]
MEPSFSSDPPPPQAVSKKLSNEMPSSRIKGMNLSLALLL